MPYIVNKETGGMDFLNANTGGVMSSTPSKISSPQQGNFLTNVLFPRTAQFGRKARAGLGIGGLSESTKKFEEEQEKRRKEIERIIAQAKQEIDPMERKRLLAQARDLSIQGTTQIKSVIGKFEQESGTNINDKDRVIAEALGVAGELGTLFVPGGAAIKSASLLKRIYGTAKLGAAVGAIHGITDPSEKEPTQRLIDSAQEAGLGFVLGGVAAPVFEIPLAAARKFIQV